MSLQDIANRGVDVPSDKLSSSERIYVKIEELRDACPSDYFLDSIDVRYSDDKEIVNGHYQKKEIYEEGE